MKAAQQAAHGGHHLYGGGEGRGVAPAQRVPDPVAGGFDSAKVAIEEQQVLVAPANPGQGRHRQPLQAGQGHPPLPTSGQ